MSVQGLTTPAQAATMTAIPLGARIVDCIQSTIFYGLIAIGLLVPVVLGLGGMILR